MLEMKEPNPSAGGEKKQWIRESEMKCIKSSPKKWSQTWIQTRIEVTQVQYKKPL